MTHMLKPAAQIREAASTYARSPAAIAFAVFALVFAVYMITIAPTVTSADSGEFITAMHVHGVAHPPGYPSWCILTGFLSDTVSLIWGNQGFTGLSSPAFRSNLMSAVYGAAGAAVLFLFLLLMTKNMLAAFAISLMAGFGETYWSQAVITEVYTLDMLFFFLVLLFVMRYLRNFKPVNILVCSVIYGLSLGNHWPLTLLWGASIFGYAIVTIIRIPDKRPSPLLVLSCVTTVIISAAACYLIMYLRALSEPAFSWGDPSNWERLLYHVSRGQYGHALAEKGVEWKDKAFYFSFIFKSLSQQYTPLLLILVPFGIAALYRHYKSLLAIIIFILVLNPIAIILLTQAKYRIEHTIHLPEFILPMFASAAILIVFGLDFFLRRFRLLKGWPSFVMTLALPVIPLIANFNKNDMSDYWLARDFNTALLESLDRDAIMFAESDHVAFPLLYLKKVEGLRPDVVLATPTIDVVAEKALSIFERQGKLSPIAEAPLNKLGLETSPAALARLHISRGIIITSLEDSERRKLVKNSIAASLIEYSGRSVYFASRHDIPFRNEADPVDTRQPYFRVLPCGLALRVARNLNERDIESATAAIAVFTNKDSIRGVYLPEKNLNERGRLTAALFHARRAEVLVASRNRPKAEDAFRTAVAYASRNAQTINNIAALSGEYGFFDVAEKSFIKALEVDPYHKGARANLIKLYDYLLKQKDGNQRIDLEEKMRHHYEILKELES